MRQVSSGWTRLGVGFGMGLLLLLSGGKENIRGGFVSHLVSSGVAFAQEGTDEGHPLNDRYDSAVARAEARYHQAVANARKTYLENKRKADAIYDHETSVASRHVTGTINDIKNKLAETGGSMGEQVTSSIKSAVGKYAKTISSDFQKRQVAVKKAVETYVKALSDATSTFGKDVQRANGKLSSGKAS